MRYTGFDLLSLGMYRGVEYYLKWNGYLYRSGRLLPVYGYLGIPERDSQIRLFASKVWDRIHQSEDLNLFQICEELKALKRHPEEKFFFLKMPKMSVTYKNGWWIIGKKKVNNLTKTGHFLINKRR